MSTKTDRLQRMKNRRAAYENECRHLPGMRALTFEQWLHEANRAPLQAGATPYVPTPAVRGEELLLAPGQKISRR